MNANKPRNRKFEITIRCRDDYNQLTKIKQVFTAKDEDDAWTQCEEQNKKWFLHDNSAEMQDIEEVFDTVLNEKYVYITMSDGKNYGLFVMKLAKLVAQKMAKDEGVNDYGLIMANKIIPLFEADEQNIEQFRKQLTWEEIKPHLIQLVSISSPKPDFEKEWQEQDFSIKDLSK